MNSCVGVEASVQTEPGGRVTVALRGKLDALTTGQCWRDLEQRLPGSQITSLEVDASQLVSCGTNGVVTLRGSVPTARDRDKIVAHISKIPGVDPVENHLRAGA